MLFPRSGGYSVEQLNKIRALEKLFPRYGGYSALAHRQAQ